MEYANVGSSGLLVSKIGVGCNQFGGKVDAATTKQSPEQVVENVNAGLKPLAADELAAVEATINQAAEG